MGFVKVVRFLVIVCVLKVLLFAHQLFDKISEASGLTFIRCLYLRIIKVCYFYRKNEIASSLLEF